MSELGLSAAELITHLLICHKIAGAVKTTTKVVVYVVTPVKITLAFNKHVEHKYVASKIRISCNNDLVKGEWFSCTKNQFDVLWILNHDTMITENDVIKVKKKMIHSNKFYLKLCFINKT